MAPREDRIVPIGNWESRKSNKAKRVALGNAVLAHGVAADVSSSEPTKLSNAKVGNVDITFVRWIELYNELDGNEVGLAEFQKSWIGASLIQSFAASTPRTLMTSVIVNRTF